MLLNPGGSKQRTALSGKIIIVFPMDSAGRHDLILKLNNANVVTVWL